MHFLHDTIASHDLTYDDVFMVPRHSAVASRYDVDRLERLTPREAEVLHLVAAGRSDSEIAAALVVSVETVKTHVGTALTKMDAPDRTNAAVLAWRSGFVS